MVFDDHRAPGDRWLNDLRCRIEDADAVVVVMTPAAEQSDWVRIEIRAGRDAGRPIVPLLLAGEPFRSLDATGYQDVSGRRLPGEAFLARLRSAPAARPAGRPVRIAGINPDSGGRRHRRPRGLRDRVDGARPDRADAAGCCRPGASPPGAAVDHDRRGQGGAAAAYGRRGRIRPFRIDDRIASAYETAVHQACRAIGELADDKALARGRGAGQPGPAVAWPAWRSGRPTVDDRVRTAIRSVDQARAAARALAGEVYATGVDVCGFDLSALIVDDLERLDGFRWDSTTRWPRKLVDAVFARSITAGNGTMLVRPPIGSGD